MSDDLLADTFAMIEGRLSALELLVIASRDPMGPDEAAEFARRLTHLGAIMLRPGPNEDDSDKLIAQYRTIALERLSSLTLALANRAGPDADPRGTRPTH